MEHCKMANPFLVESKPIDMSGLQMAASQYGQQRRASEQQQEQQQQQQALGEQASQLFESGTPQEIAQFSIKNPNFGKLISQQIGFKNDATQANMKKGMQDIILNPANTEQILNERVKMVQAEGGDPSDTFGELAKYQEDPAGYITGIRKSYAVMDPQGSMALEKAENAGKPTAMTKTATQKDFAEYQNLLQTNPEGAKQFGTKAGFIATDKPKRLFQVKKNDDGTTTKYFSNGDEETVSPKANVKTPDMRAPMNQVQAMKIIDKAKEGQLKNAGFALTMNDGISQMNSMEAQGYDPTSAAWVQTYLAGTTAGNLAMSEQDQQYVGAVEQMINAIARRETGAAITEFEKKDFFNRYMPAAGDKPARIKQKKAALERQFKSIRGQSGSTYDAIRVSQGMQPDKPQQEGQSLPAQQQEQVDYSAPPTQGVVVDGYKFNGGDPRDQSNWSRM